MNRSADNDDAIKVNLHTPKMKFNHTMLKNPNQLYLQLILFLLPLLSFSQNASQNNSAQSRTGNANGNQGYGIVSGIVHDKLTNQHIEYSNVLLFRAKDSSMVTGTITDTKGKFILRNLQPGKYYIRIQFIGYQNYEIPDVNISPKSADIKLGDITLAPNSSSIQGVEITSERSLITNNLDKKVISVDKNMALGGGTATDVMENVPSVTVDEEGNISLRGKSNITLLIDGKPASQAGIAASDMLNQLPASAIESVEVITNPSVKYDPDGTSGIINIVLKKKALQGFNGMVSLNAGTGDKYNGSLVLNYRHDKFNAFFNADGRINNMIRNYQSTRISTGGEPVSVLDQSEEGKMTHNMGRLSVGFDYFIDTRNNITLSVSKRNMSFGSDGDLINHALTNDTLVRLFNRLDESDRNIDAYEYSLSYKHLFPQKGREFTNDVIFSDNTMNSDSYITQKDFNLNSLDIPSSISKQLNTSDNKNQMLTVQGNYVYPMSTGSRIEAGYKASVKNMLEDYDYKNYQPSDSTYISQEALKNRYDYNEQIYAIYGIYANSWKKFRYQAGLRFEQVYTHSMVGLDNNKTELNKQYSSFYPSFHTQYDIGKNKELQLSYSRRVRRPSPHEMNPYVDYGDSLNLRTGNPALKPEFTNSIEFGMLQYWNSNSLTASVFYRYTDDEVEHITGMLENGATLTMPVNISKETNYGLELVGTVNPTKWIRANGNLSFYRALMTAVPEYNLEGSDQFSWTARLNVAITPWKDGTFQVIGNYNSPRRSVQELDKARVFADMSFRQDLLKKKISVSLRLTDVFKTRRFDEIVYGDGFTTESQRRPQSRVLYLGIQYQFNNFSNKKNNQDPNTNNGFESEGEDF